MGGASRFIFLLATPFSLISSRSSLFRLSHRLSSSSLASLSSSTHLLPLSHNAPPQLGFPLKASQQIHTQTSSVREDRAGDSLGLSRENSHPWIEWSKLVDTVSAGGYFGGQRFDEDDAFVVCENLSEEFVRTASACLVFARDRSNLLGSLSRTDIEIVVDNGRPFLFKSALDTARRMRSFLASNVVESEDKAHTVDLMKYLLSYASNPIVSSESNSMYNRELVESSVRNLLSQLAEASYGAPGSGFRPSTTYPSVESYGQTPRPFGQKIEMKRGDWICSRCSFMNFARNVKCIECDEARPKRQLTGGEWECPQCEFFNYGRNLVCLRCDCKRPGEVSSGTHDYRPSLGYNIGNVASRADVDSRLAANEEKAQRWFSKVSQLDNASDLSKAAAGEDFPEIMPLRKGVNRFVVSTRKTPLERRLANSQYRRNLGDNDSSEGNHIQPGASNDTLDKSIGRSLDEILGRRTTSSNADNKSLSDGQNAETNSSPPLFSSASLQYGQSKASNSNYVPFVPLPADMFAKKPQSSKEENSDNTVTGSRESRSSNANVHAGPVSTSSEFGGYKDNLQFSEKPVSPSGSEEKEKEQAEKSERWFKRVAELHDVTDLASAISDEDFPEIMPMRKGENRFVVSKKKDRSMTSPMYKRKMAMEQSSNTNFVPFVPFPPDYFAKKDKQQPNVADPTVKPAGETSSSISRVPEKLTEKSDDVGPRVSDVDYSQRTGGRQISSPTQNVRFSGENPKERETDTTYRAPISENVTQNSFNSQNSSRNGWSTGNSRKENATEANNTMGNSSQILETRDVIEPPPQQPDTPNVRSGWTGKSLEGSAVKEIDPLDMSEEAKAERWFRRVAQIKDISELSQIPDEDFPSIMPMRKGVNRFVVSKRKTPLERRLTSPQYRRNLPIVSSDPTKNENDKS